MTVSPGELLKGSDDVGAWIRLGRLSHRVVRRRMEEEPSPETDKALDSLIILRRWTARRLVN